MKLKIAAALAATLLATSAFAQAPKLATDEIMVKSPDPGIEIYVRNKRPTGMTSFRPERTLLYVHGATYPASTAFDLPLDGQSWMDYIAARGYDVYLLDIRGYGKSSPPKEMSEDAKANPPSCDRRIRLGVLRHLLRPARFAVAANVEEIHIVPARRCSPSRTGLRAGGQMRCSRDRLRHVHKAACARAGRRSCRSDACCARRSRCPDRATSP